MTENNKQSQNNQRSNAGYGPNGNYDYQPGRGQSGQQNGYNGYNGRPGQSGQNGPRRPQKPKKSLLYYYSIVMIVVFLFNIFLAPMINDAKSMVEATTYDTFLDMVEKGQVHVV